MDLESQGFRGWSEPVVRSVRHDTEKPFIYQWTFVGGEIPLSLILIEPESDGEKFYEVARILDNKFLVDIFIKDGFREIAQTYVADGEEWIDVFRREGSPEELEGFCRKSYLPLPPSYREIWDNFGVNHLS